MKLPCPLYAVNKVRHVAVLNNLTGMFSLAKHDFTGFVHLWLIIGTKLIVAKTAKNVARFASIPAAILFPVHSFILICYLHKGKSC